MAISYLFPPDGSNARSVALASYSAGLLVAKWDSPTVWYWSGSEYAFRVFTTTTNYGFSSVTSDTTGGVWLPQYYGQLVHYLPDLTFTLYQLPSDITTGCAFIPAFSRPYVMGASGNIYTTSGTGTISVGQPFPHTTWGLAATGKTLFTILGDTGQLGIQTLSTSGVGVSGAITPPMNQPMCLTGTTSSVTLAGWTNTTIPTRFDALSANPMVGTIAGLNTTNNLIYIYQSIDTNVWTSTLVLPASGNPQFLSWSTDGLHLAISDPVTGLISIFDYVFGNLVFSQDLAFTNPESIAFVSPTTVLVVAHSTVTPVSLSDTTWVSGAPLTVGATSNIIQTDSNQAIVGFNDVLNFLGFNADTNTLSLLTGVQIPFTPSFVASDFTGSTCAIATLGAYGLISIFLDQTLQTTLSWVGEASSATVYRDQFIVVDPSIPGLRIFGYLNGQYQQISIISSPLSDGITTVPSTPYSLGGTTMVMGVSSIYEFQFLSPFGLSYVPNGMVSTYANGSWTNTILGVNQKPTAIAYDIYGNIKVTTSQNNMFTIDPVGNIVSTDAIPPYPGQFDGVPLGFSSLVAISSGFFGITSLAGVLANFGGTFPVPPTAQYVLDDYGRVMFDDNGIPLLVG